MSARVHFHSADLQRFFQIIGSADRDLLREIGVTLGVEFRPPTNEELDDRYGDEDAGDEEWDAEVEELDSAREAIIKMIMAGMPGDLADDEAHGLQDFLASYATSSDAVHALDADEVADAAPGDAEDMIHEHLLKGLELAVVEDFVEWLHDGPASADLAWRAQVVSCGRLPEADEATFTDPDEAYGARFGYLWRKEMAEVADEMDEIAQSGDDGAGPPAVVLAAVFRFCRDSVTDLIVTVEE